MHWHLDYSFFMISRRNAECHESRALLSGWWITRRFKASDPLQPDYTAAVNGDTFRHSSHRHVRTWMASVLSVAAAFLWHEDTELVPRHLTLPQRLDHLPKGYCYVFSHAQGVAQRSELSRLWWQSLSKKVSITCEVTQHQSVGVDIKDYCYFAATIAARYIKMPKIREGAY